MLTDIAIRKAKPGERLVKLSDSGGLQFWITPSGGKLWYLAYRFGGRQKKLAIGAYGAAPAGVTLEAARARRDEAKALLRQGIDPAAGEGGPGRISCQHVRGGRRRIACPEEA